MPARSCDRVRLIERPGGEIKYSIVKGLPRVNITPGNIYLSPQANCTVSSRAG